MRIYVGKEESGASVQDIGSWDFPAMNILCPQDDLSFRVSLCSPVGCITQLFLPHLHLPTYSNYSSILFLKLNILLQIKNKLK